jgi:hypothetical protein
MADTLMSDTGACTRQTVVYLHGTSASPFAIVMFRLYERHEPVPISRFRDDGQAVPEALPDRHGRLF